MNLRQVRTKIKSVGNVKKITKAMQMISAIKMRKAQAEAIEGRPYLETLTEMIQKVTQRVDVSHSPLLQVRPDAKEKRLVIFVSSNKGLAGTFHTNLARFLFKQIELEKCDFLAVGKKGATLVNGAGGTVIAEYSEKYPVTAASAVFELALKKFLSGDYNQVSVVYNKFISTLRSETVEEVLLPFKLEIRSKDEIASPVERARNDNTGEYLIEPSAAEIIEPLLKSYIEEKIRGAMMNSEAVEHSARMIAMKNATDNANDVIYNLTLLGNKIRQGKITGELLDMITAKESVEV
jgi:F-type H+-transporting ATPase subunit gamma